MPTVLIATDIRATERYVTQSNWQQRQIWRRVLGLMVCEQQSALAGGRGAAAAAFGPALMRLATLAAWCSLMVPMRGWA
jgi:hypothetical protein